MCFFLLDRGSHGAVSKEKMPGLGEKSGWMADLHLNYRWAKHPPASRKPQSRTAGSQKLSAVEGHHQLAAEAGQMMMICKLGWIVYGDSMGS